MNHLRSDRRPDELREGGQVLAIFATALVAIVLLVGLVIDGGVAFVNRRDAQNVADTASLDGTKVITDHYVNVTKSDGTFYNSGDVYVAIQGNVEVANGCLASSPVPCTWSANFVNTAETVLGPVVNTTASIPAGSRGVVVAVTRKPRTFFLGVAGQGSWNVLAAATAVTARVARTPPGQLLPIATNPPQPYEPGKTYTLTEVASGGGPGGSPVFGPGNFGWLSWTGSNAAGALANSICFPDNPEFALPYQFPGDPGASNSSAVRACLNGWISSKTIVLIPVVSGCNPCNGNPASFTVTGVAAFVLTGFTGSGPVINSLTGSFIEYYSLPTVAAGLGSQAPAPGDPTFFLGIIR